MMMFFFIIKGIINWCYLNIIIYEILLKYKNIGPIFIGNNIRVENDCNVKNNSFSYYDFQPMNIVSMI